MGHASMLLYALLHLSRRQGGQPEIRDPGRPRGDASTTSSVSASSTASARAIPSTAGPRESRPPPARWARVSPRASAWPWPPDCSAAHVQPPRLRHVRLQRLRPGGRRLFHGRHRLRGGVAGRPPGAVEPVLDLRQQPHHDRGPHRARVLARTWRRGSSAYGWNVTRVGDANDVDRLDRAFQTFKKTKDRPTLIIVDSHIGYGAPTKQDTPCGPRRAARRRRDATRQGVLRLAARREVPGARRRARAVS